MNNKKILIIIFIIFNLVVYYKNKNRNKDKNKDDKIFYICSYGGSGSTILTKYLKHFGKVYHIHSRKPPINLTYIGNKNHNYIFNKNYKLNTEYKSINNTYHEHFSNELIPINNLHQYYVIYIYRNPIDAILSRFDNPNHLLHIQTNENIKLVNIIKEKKDLYQITQFFDNYNTKNINRNYKIISIKYELLFNNIEKLNKILNIKNNPSIYPNRKEKQKNNMFKNELQEIYKNLIHRMEKQNDLEII